MSINCLVGCDKCSEPQIPYMQHNFAPYVIATFTGEGGVKITVGNESAPNLTNQTKNTAMIKSFEFGKSDGIQAVLEIVDEEGGSMGLIVKQIPIVIGESGSVFVEIQWGWTGVDCNNVPDSLNSSIVKAIAQHVEVDYTGGKVKYKVTCLDQMQAVMASRSNRTYGTSDQPISLKEAIRRLANDENPKFSVKFENREGTGEFEFNTPEGPDGPKNYWQGDNQNKLSTIKKWIEPFRTKENRGIIAYWDYAHGKQLVLKEGVNPDCDGFDPCKLSVGTFIVNGGNCSNVINFTPKVNWTLSWGNFGRGGGLNPYSAKPDVIKKDCEGQSEEAGIQTTVVPSRQAYDAYGKDAVGKETTKSIKAHNKAETFFTGGLTAPITAELTIQGTTKEEFISPILSIGKTVSVVVINPFNLRNMTDETCSDWLAQPACNEVLTNKGWMIQGVGHQISEGSFTTTLNLFLPVPGIHFSPGTPLGGPGGSFVP